jgi:uracil-DNA glycosylase
MITERPENFEHWRRIARELLARRASPPEVRWLAEDPRGDLFAERPVDFAAGLSARASGTRLPGLIVPREFVELASLVACHCDPARWDLLYRALWRITRGERRLLSLGADETASRLLAMEDAVRRDIRRTKTLVRFQKHAIDGREHYLAWHRPDHPVLNLVAPFFRRRFRSLRWTLMTPDGCVSWDGATLRRGPGVSWSAPPPTDDNLVALWRASDAAKFTPPTAFTALPAEADTDESGRSAALSPAPPCARRPGCRTDSRARDTSEIEPD